jgi:hypothetical protein
VLTSLGQVSSGTPVAIAGQTPSKNTKRSKIPKERRQKLEKIASDKGITVEALIAERSAAERKAKKVSTNPVAKVNS